MDNEKILADIRAVKEDVQVWGNAAVTIADLEGEAVDRDHPYDLWEFSDRELDAWMGDQLSRLNRSIDPRPVPGEITSHRRFLGPVIVRVKRLIMKTLNIYTHSILERQRRFNTESVALQLSAFIRIRRIQAALDDIQRNLAERRERESLEEHLDTGEEDSP